MKLIPIDTQDLMNEHLKLPEADSIHFCIFSVTDIALLSSDRSMLSAEELSHADSLHQEQDRLRFLTGHILLRKILGQYLNCPPQSLPFCRGLHGKPFLNTRTSFDTANFGTENSDTADSTANFDAANSDTSAFDAPVQPVHFNISHSGEYVALAFSIDAPIGIDLEHPRDNARVEALVKRFFHPDEYQEFLQLPEEKRSEFLFRRWTLREAFLKGIGSGLTVSPRSFYLHRVEISPASPEDRSFPGSVYRIKKSREDYSSWLLESLPAPAGYYLSIAYQRPV